eukprot:6825927-Pyramimonas_sp.AAC.1
MVEHRGALGLRGGMYIITQYSKDTCSDASAYAEASCFRPTSLRYYAPEGHPPSPIGNFFEDRMHENENGETKNKSDFVGAMGL